MTGRDFMAAAGGPDIERWAPAWPGGARCAVMLSFDVDGRTLWSPKDRATSTGIIDRGRSMGDYGTHAGMPRIVPFLDRLGVPATFFVPGFIAENYPDAIRPAVDAGHEVGLHGYLHESFYDHAPDAQRSILERAKAVFAENLGVVPRGFRAPSGDWTAETPGILSDLGVRYSSSFRGDDRPFLWEFAGERPDLVEIPGHWELDDFPQFAYNDWPPEPKGQDRPASSAASFENWRWEFEGYHREGLCWVLMTHPQVIGTPNRLRHLERLIDDMRGRGDVWFATGSQIADWVLANRDAGPGDKREEQSP